MATVEDFKDAVRDHLAQSGALKKMQASIRAEIINSLADPVTQGTRPSVPKDTYVINELIREYMAFHGYRASLSVFEPESGMQEGAALDREFVADRLKVTLGPQSEQLPLLYSIVRKSAQS